MNRQGYSNRHIARKTGLDRRTVGKYLKEQKAPDYNKVFRIIALEQYKPLIDGWLRQDDYKVTRIYELLQAQGYTGSYGLSLKQKGMGVPKAVTVTYLYLL